MKHKPMDSWKITVRVIAFQLFLSFVKVICPCVFK